MTCGKDLNIIRFCKQAFGGFYRIEAIKTAVFTVLAHDSIYLNWQPTETHRKLPSSKFGASLKCQSKVLV